GHIWPLRRSPSYVMIPTLSFSFPAPPPAAISTLSLHDALPISRDARGRAKGRHSDRRASQHRLAARGARRRRPRAGQAAQQPLRSEEHTSELQSPYDLVCRLLLEKKKKSTPNQKSTKQRTSTSP